MLFAQALALTLAASAQPSTPQRIVIGSGIRLRDRPALDGKTVGRLPLGSSVPCLERSGQASAEGKTGPFCKTKLENGTFGWFFEPATAAFEPAEASAAYEAIAKERHEALGYCAERRKSDVWGFQRFILERIKAAKTPAEKAAWRFEELRLLQKQACLFLKGDKRIYRDESQGARLKRDVIWNLVKEAKPADPALGERIAWFAVEHGHDFECEGWGPCYLAWRKQIECQYLEHFPKGAHAKDALEKIAEVAESVKKDIGGELKVEDLGPEDKKNIEIISRCVKIAPAEQSARAAQQRASAALGALKAAISK